MAPRWLAALHLAGLAVAGLCGAGPVRAQPLEEVRVVDDTVPEPLAGLIGDADRGRRIVLDRASGNCLICHTVPEPQERFMGDIGPGLDGVASRLDAGQLRLRVVDAARLNPATVMPPYHRTAGLTRVGPPWRDKPVLSAQQIEDVVAYLATLTHGAGTTEPAR